MRSDIEQLVLRAATALLRLGGDTRDAGWSEDLGDDALGLVRAIADGDHDAMARVCRDALGHLDAAEPANAGAARSAVLVLRLQARLREFNPLSPAIAPREGGPSTDKTPKKDSSERGPKLKDTQKMLVEYVRDHPDVRTSDLIASQTGRASSRTVMRSLKELVGSGVLKRTLGEGGAISYRIA